MVNILNYEEHNFPRDINSGTVFGIRVSILGIVQSLSSLGLYKYAKDTDARLGSFIAL